MNPRQLAALLSLVLAAALPASAQVITPAAYNSDPDMLEVRTYPLTMDKVEKLAATVDALDRLEAADPALKTKMDTEPSDDQTIDAKVNSLDTRYPEAADVVHRNGLTSREYILVSLAFVNDMTFVSMKRQGALQSYPPGSITPANAAFVDANYAKLEQLSEKISGASN
jgi:hypothetical protein